MGVIFLHSNHSNVLVEREGFAFFSDIEYENIPVLCSHCKKIGHEVQDCKFLKKITANTNPKGQTTYVPKVTNVIPSAPVIIKATEVNIESDRRDLNTSKRVDIAADTKQMLVDTRLGEHNPLNFVSQLSEDSDTQLSNFIEATPDKVGTLLVANNADASFLKNSWGNIEEIDKRNSRGEGAFKTKATLHYKVPSRPEA
ncbi:uncharacterized protein LOC131634703 [Vicia villosa]|uniref:uncharacterized protein LOC131634703 n=1 Tax=Vicia villosa TaxID=3911 RepID=UPI00273BAE6E|nr:uncharacterized protein LOC131634703 [Vicia villosa]